MVENRFDVSLSPIRMYSWPDRVTGPNETRFIVAVELGTIIAPSPSLDGLPTPPYGSLQLIHPVDSLGLVLFTTFAKMLTALVLLVSELADQF